MPTLLQTQFLKRYITMEILPIPIGGPFAGVSVARNWFNTSFIENKPFLAITPVGIKEFWKGVKQWGADKVMSKPIGTPPINPTPTDGGSAPPISIAA